jgi:radical SAM superfamily enzyme YgiQ (UPF0313 family)
MKILFIQPPIEDFYTTPIRLYPLGLLYAAATAQHLGHEVEILDCLNPPKKRQLPIPADFSYLVEHFENNPYVFKNYYRFGLTDDQIIQHIHQSQPQLIGISSQFSAYFTSVEKVAKLIKQHFDIPIFIGGNHASAFPEKIQEKYPEIDHVLVGPAEKSLPPFLSSLCSDKNEQNIIDWKYLRPLHELLKSTDYRMGKKSYMSLAASRGCPYKCEFCSVHNMFGRRMTYREVEDVIDEMRHNYINKNIRIFNFEDDNLSFNKPWFRQFLNAVIADPDLQDIEITALNGICYPTLNDELLELMHEAGFRQLHLSFVTHDESLRYYLKRPDPQRDLEQIVKKGHELGFFMTVYVIIGLPGQTYDEVKTSINYLLDLDVLVGPSVFYIPAASELYDKLDLNDPLRDNWNLYRSSAFAVETEHLNRSQLVELFSYTREQNLLRKTERRT